VAGEGFEPSTFGL